MELFLNGFDAYWPCQLFPGGVIAEPATYGLTAQLKELGFEVGRMKTGTPVRIDGRSIDFSKLTEQDGV